MDDEQQQGKGRAGGYGSDARRYSMGAGMNGNALHHLLGSGGLHSPGMHGMLHSMMSPPYDLAGPMSGALLGEPMAGGLGLMAGFV